LDRYVVGEIKIPLGEIEILISPRAN
jgi:hypothetical protein